MTHLEIVTAYLAHTDKPTIQGLLGYIDVYDRTVPTFEEPNAIVAAARSDSLRMVDLQSYQEICHRNMDMALSHLQSTGMSEHQIKTILERFRNAGTKL